MRLLRVEAISKCHARGSKISQRPQAALLAVSCLALLRAGATICEYGSLPGMMVKSSSAPFSLNWEVFDKNCPIKDELSRIIGPPPWTFAHSQNPNMPYHMWAKDAKTPMISNIGPQIKIDWEAPPQWAKPFEPISMLFYGDSVDSNQIVDFCKEAQVRTIQVNMGGFGRNCPACFLGTGIKMIEEFVPGTWPTGPYLDHYGNADAPHLNIPKGFQHLQQSTGSNKPDIVVYNAHLWDLGRLQVVNAREHAQPFLTAEFVREHMTYLNKWMDLIETSAPADALLVFHNAAYPRLKDCRLGAEHSHAPLGQQMHVIQLNAASRQVVSSRERWHLVDFGQMSEATMMDSAHLRDGLHPNSQFSAQTFNIVLNLYREHKLALNATAG